MREFHVERFRARSLPAWFAVALMNKFHHFFQRGAGKKNFVHAFAFHDRGVLMSDRPAATAEDLDVVRAFFAQKIDNLREKFDMPTVVTGNADGANVFLNGRTDNIADRPVIPEVSQLNTAPNEDKSERNDGVG